MITVSPPTRVMLYLSLVDSFLLLFHFSVLTLRDGIVG